ncbi:uncharacterized protein LOC111001902 [Pieris rapae]|uniref:uncharacterized protein LOC111001902 n=1 Tax=Pieris rapae TaxID=64459 RepID=UPI000B92CF2B|nr:uncharacterized protein LOC111001902 [Pieris rapae]
MKYFIVFLSMCMLSAAANLRERRDNYPNGSAIICAPQTPCGWKVYNPVTKMIEVTVINKYCICREGLSCTIATDIQDSSTYQMNCQDPVPEVEGANEETGDE